MRHDEFMKIHDEFTSKMREICAVKNRDYSVRGRVLDFGPTAQELGVTELAVWGVYFLKHVRAILNYVRDGRVCSEPIENRLLDVANYCVLLQALIHEQAANKDEGAESVVAQPIRHWTCSELLDALNAVDLDATKLKTVGDVIDWLTKHGAEQLAQQVRIKMNSVDTGTISWKWSPFCRWLKEQADHESKAAN